MSSIDANPAREKMDEGVGERQEGERRGGSRKTGADISSISRYQVKA